MAMVITQKFWEWGDPLPPLLGKIPKKYRFFFWKTPLSLNYIKGWEPIWGTGSANIDYELSLQTYSLRPIGLVNHPRRDDVRYS